MTRDRVNALSWGEPAEAAPIKTETEGVTNGSFFDCGTKISRNRRVERCRPCHVLFRAPTRPSSLNDARLAFHHGIPLGLLPPDELAAVREVTENPLGLRDDIARKLCCSAPILRRRLKAAVKRLKRGYGEVA